MTITRGAANTPETRHPSSRRRPLGRRLLRRSAPCACRYARTSEDLVRLIAVARTFRRGPRGDDQHVMTPLESHRANSWRTAPVRPRDGANVSLQIAILIALPDPCVALPARGRQPRSLPGSLRAPTPRYEHAPLPPSAPAPPGSRINRNLSASAATSPEGNENPVSPSTIKSSTHPQASDAMPVPHANASFTTRPNGSNADGRTNTSAAR